MSIADNLKQIMNDIPQGVTLIAVSKTKPAEAILEAYQQGQKVFGENKVQEMAEKHDKLPKDIHWHLIGHLQTNKVKYIAGFVHLIHSIDSLKLLKEVNKEGIKNNRIIDCLVQVHIAQEDTKFGFSFHEADELLSGQELKNLSHIRITGLMGMASNTENKSQIKAEFKTLADFFEKAKQHYNQKENVALTTLSMGMSGDYKIAIAAGSNMVRVGSAIFGDRDYTK